MLINVTYKNYLSDHKNFIPNERFKWWIPRPKASPIIDDTVYPEILVVIDYETFLSVKLLIFIYFKKLEV